MARGPFDDLNMVVTKLLTEMGQWFSEKPLLVPTSSVTRFEQVPDRGPGVFHTQPCEQIRFGNSGSRSQYGVHSIFAQVPISPCENWPVSQNMSVVLSGS